MSNITQIVRTERNLTILKKAVIASGLDQMLSSAGPYTVFAPSDLAFEKLESGMVDNLLKPENKLQLTSLINQHVVEGSISFKDLKDGDKLTTLNGKELSVKVSGTRVSVDGAIIEHHDVKTSNGIIHSVNSVLKS